MALEAKMERTHECIDRIATAAVSPGEMRQLPDGRAAYYAGSKAIAIGEKYALQTEGIVKVPKTASIALLDGGRVFWDKSASTATFRPGSGEDFYLGTVDGDAAAADTHVYVNLNVEPHYVISTEKSGFTAVAVANGATTRLDGVGHSLAFTTATEAQKADLLSDDSVTAGTPFIADFDFGVFDNGDDAALDFNIGIANGTHASDADTITESAFLHLDGNALDLSTESDDGTNETAATDTTINIVEDVYNILTIDARDNTDVVFYFNGVEVTAGDHDVSEATGPWKLLAHLEKSSNDTPGEARVKFMGIRTMDAA